MSATEGCAYKQRALTTSVFRIRRVSSSTSWELLNLPFRAGGMASKWATQSLAALMHVTHGWLWSQHASYKGTKAPGYRGAPCMTKHAAGRVHPRRDSFIAQK